MEDTARYSSLIRFSLAWLIASPFARHGGYDKAICEENPGCLASSKTWFGLLYVRINCFYPACQREELNARGQSSASQHYSNLLGLVVHSVKQSSGDTPQEAQVNHAESGYIYRFSWNALLDHEQRLIHARTTLTCVQRNALAYEPDNTRTVYQRRKAKNNGTPRRDSISASLWNHHLILNLLLSQSPSRTIAYHLRRIAWALVALMAKKLGHDKPHSLQPILFHGQCYPALGGSQSSRSCLKRVVVPRNNVLRGVSCVNSLRRTRNVLGKKLPEPSTNRALQATNQVRTNIIGVRDHNSPTVRTTATYRTGPAVMQRFR